MYEPLNNLYDERSREFHNRMSSVMENMLLIYVKVFSINT